MANNRANVAANLKRIQELYDQVKAHPMCLKIKDDGTYIVITYPAGDWPSGVNGVQCAYGIRKGEGKGWALQKVLDRMESDWLTSIPGRAPSA